MGYTTPTLQSRKRFYYVRPAVMSFRHTGLWHYEHIPDRANGREWRVTDSDDDVVTEFHTEDEAIDFVREHNRSVDTRERWW